MLKNVNWDITSKCNLRCKHCGAATTVEREIPTKIVRKVLKDLSDMGCYHVTMAGGEPLVRKDIFEILKEASDLNIQIAILTNGSLLTRQTVEKLSKLNNISYIRVSLDYANEKMHDKFRGVDGTFRRVKKGISYLTDASIRVGIGSTILPDNLSEIEGLINFSIQNNVDFIRIVPAAKIGRAKQYDLDIIHYVSVLKSILDNIAKHIQYLKLGVAPVPWDSGEIGELLATRCPGGLETCSISSDGFIKLCPMLPTHINEKYNIEKRSFKEVWEDIKNNVATIRPDIIYLKGKCARCSIRDKCNGGCILEKTSRGLNIDDEQPICPVEIIKSALKERILDRNIRRILSDVLYRYSLSPSACFRSLPIWYYMLKK